MPDPLDAAASSADANRRPPLGDMTCAVSINLRTQSPSPQRNTAGDAAVSLASPWIKRATTKFTPFRERGASTIVYPTAPTPVLNVAATLAEPKKDIEINAAAMNARSRPPEEFEK